jgi:hypothetical protein
MAEAHHLRDTAVVVFVGLDRAARQKALGV